MAQQIARRQAAVLLGQAPVLDAGRLTGEGKGGQIADSVEVLGGPELGVHRDAAVIRQAQIGEESGGRRDAGTHQHQVGGQLAAVLEADLADVSVAGEAHYLAGGRGRSRHWPRAGS